MRNKGLRNRSGGFAGKMEERYIIIVASHTKHDCDLGVYGTYRLKDAVAKLSEVLEECGCRQADQLPYEHDWEEGDFKWENDGVVVQMTGVAL